MSVPHRLLEEYQDLNVTDHDTYSGAPSPLEFMRMVHISRPVLFKDCPLSLRNDWTDEYLATNVKEVSVAVTPDGRADALADHEDGTTYFVEPLVEQITMKELLSSLSSEASNKQNEVRYLQSQNDNLRLSSSKPTGEFEGIRNDVPSDIEWATEALGRGPDAVNIWIGDHRSVTSIHSDPYENIYAVVRGTKVFTLYPPTEGWLLEEKEYPHARWARDSTGSLTLQPSVGRSIRWSSVRDPTLPLPPSRPVTAVVRAGQILYLPTGWWHYVQQVPDDQGKVIAVNYWYDQEMRGHGWVFLNFLRSLGSIKNDKLDE